MPDRDDGDGRSHTPRFSVGRPSKRARNILLTVAALAVLAILFAIFSGFWTDWLWFRSLGFSSVYTTKLWTQIGLFLAFGVLMAVIVGGNIYLAHRKQPPLTLAELPSSLQRYREALAPYRKWVLAGLSVVIMLFAGAAATGQWRTWLKWINGQSFGVTDKQFHMDVSFYAFDLPWYRFLLNFGFAAVVLSLVAAVVVHYLYGGLRMPSRERSAGRIATAAAQGHLSVLLGVFVTLKAVAYWLDRYSLAVKSSDFKATSGWAGLRYVDANAYLPAKTILFCVAIICAVLFFVTLWRRTWAMPLVGLGLMVLSAILIGGLYPAIVQRFQVQPNEQVKEEPYIKKNIEATRYAYNIDDTKINKNYEPKKNVDRKELAKDRVTTNSIRLLDPNVVSPTFQQLQQVRGFYSFPQTLDVDRYTNKKGKTQDTVVGLRELNLNGITDSQRNWVNDHFKYTHGYGMVSAKGTSVRKDGEPKFTSYDLPPKGKLGKYEPRVYYGEETSQYSVVGGKGMKEIDYSDNSGQKVNSYKGKGGVGIDNPFTRAAYAVKFSEPQLFYSGAIKDGSKILYDRKPKERVEKVAPWLTIDGDPYPAVVHGRLKWIVDGYTTTNNFPYSSRTTLGDATADSLTDNQRSVVSPANHVNYIRNSVKATVDAYDGAVNMYQWDEKDPVLQTWMKAFPGTVKPKSEISKDLKEHLRYPEDLFKVQRQMLTRYHVTEPKAFFSGSDFWKVPDDPTNRRGESQPPYYETVRMPDQRRARFSLTSTFVPNKRLNLAAFMAVDSDPGPDYGKIRVLQLPTSTTTSGPKQVQSKFNSDPKIAEKINLLKRGDSEVSYGNLLTLPVGGGLLYVEPVYVKGTGTSYPLLRKVLAVYGDKIAFEDSLDAAMDKVLGTDSGSDKGSKQPSGGEKGSSKPAPAVQKHLDDAKRYFDEGQKALGAKNLGKYAEAQKKLQKALDAAISAQQGSTDAKKSASKDSDSSKDSSEDKKSSDKQE